MNMALCSEEQLIKIFISEISKQITPQLHKAIAEETQTFITQIDALDAEQQLCVLHLLAPLNEETVIALGKSIDESLETDSALEDSLETDGDESLETGNATINVILKFMDIITHDLIYNIEEKGGENQQKYNFPQELKNKFPQSQINFIIATQRFNYILAHVYETIYNHLEKKNNKLMLAFDETGFIQPQNRTKFLPKPQKVSIENILCREESYATIIRIMLLIP